MPVALSPPPRRRSRSLIEDDVDADNLRASGRSNSSALNSAKRPRTNGHERDSATPSGSEEGEENTFQPGAIVRVRLQNFVTYEETEFSPGPHLNMVIGPNGTGKSSLVCAICLGLGWGPQHLGRATQLGEFVKHGMRDAMVEVELQGGKDDESNHVVRLRIIRDGNAREWWLNGRKTSLKAVQALTKKLSIQIDNLCQFLPQDKVSEFAALSPVELLQQTQRAAAPEEMLEQHEELKRLRKDQKGLETQHQADQARMQNLETRQQNLRVEVERLEERNQVEENIEFLEKSIFFADYRHKLQQHKEYQQRKNEARRRLKELQEQVAPTLQSVTQKKGYRDQIGKVVSERKKIIQEVEKEADDYSAKIESFDQGAKAYETEMDAAKLEGREFKTKLTKVEREITELESKMREPLIEFNAATYNEQIRAKEAETRAIGTQIKETADHEWEFSVSGKNNRDDKEACKDAIGALDSQEGKDLAKLEGLSPDTVKLWKWVQENQNQFEKEVFGPPAITCSVKDPRYTDAIEALFQMGTYLAIIAQTQNDYNKIDRQINMQKLSKVTLRAANDPLDIVLQKYPPILTPHELERSGFEGWAIDFINAPSPVLAMLCLDIRISISVIALKDISQEQHESFTQSGVRTWVAGRNKFTISGRPEYGPKAISTKTDRIRTAQVLIDGPVNTSEKRRLEGRMRELDVELEALKEQLRPIKSKLKELKDRKAETEKESEALKREKEERQKAHGQQKALPDKLKRKQSDKEDVIEKIQDVKERMKKIEDQNDVLIVKRAAAAFKYKDQVLKVRARHEDLLTAEIMLVEATSDVTSLEERNSDIHQQLDEEKAKARDAEQQSKTFKDSAKRALEKCQDILSEIEDPEMKERFSESNRTVEELETEKVAEIAKLGYLHVGNSNAINDFRNREEEVNKLREKINETEKKLNRIERQVEEVRGNWEPELDKLIAEINDAFAYNFEQIGCAGEVGVHKDDDIDLWAIQIKVRFRENETLQLLDAHRQSGGERSVSTIFYLMSLQSLARAPFLVVDEINQGMDPRNERMVHERMVEIACKEHTSQYFLITPKLLTGLWYDKRMKVLCIASGEYMPKKDEGKLDLDKMLRGKRRLVAATAAA